MLNDLLFIYTYYSFVFLILIVETFILYYLLLYYIKCRCRLVVTKD